MNNLYNELHILSNSLKNNGMDSVSHELNDILDFGSTATEILMKAKFHLSSIDLTDKRMTEEDVVLISKLIKEINAYLQ